MAPDIYGLINIREDPKARKKIMGGLSILIKSLGGDPVKVLRKLEVGCWRIRDLRIRKVRYHARDREELDSRLFNSILEYTREHGFEFASVYSC